MVIEDERLSSLKSKHADLDRVISEEEKRLHPDDMLLAQLKREKLRLKDQIVSLSRP
jgi:hypothetical protein